MHVAQCSCTCIAQWPPLCAASLRPNFDAKEMGLSAGIYAFALLKMNNFSLQQCIVCNFSKNFIINNVNYYATPFYR